MRFLSYCVDLDINLKKFSIYKLSARDFLLVSLAITLFTYTTYESFV